MSKNKKDITIHSGVAQYVTFVAATGDENPVLRCAMKTKEAVKDE